LLKVKIEITNIFLQDAKICIISESIFEIYIYIYIVVDNISYIYIYKYKIMKFFLSVIKYYFLYVLYKNNDMHYVLCNNALYVV